MFVLAIFLPDRILSSTRIARLGAIGIWQVAGMFLARIDSSGIQSIPLLGYAVLFLLMTHVIHYAN